MPASPSDVISRVLERFERVSLKHDHWIAACPVPHHGQGRGDRRPSVSVSEGDDGRVLVKCKAGCSTEAVLQEVGLEMRDLFPNDRQRSDSSIPGDNTATLQHSGCTLGEYAENKQIPVDFLKHLGVAEVLYMGKPAVRIPYPREDGTEGTARYRIQMEKTEHFDRFRWKKRTRSFLYGLDRLEQYRAGKQVVLVEGESDCHTAWLHGIPAIGLPGATNWKEDRDAKLFDGFDRIYIVVEPDQGGEAVRRWLQTSAIRDRAYLIDLGESKDISGVHISDDDFDTVWTAALDRAVPWESVEQQEANQEAAAAWEVCSELAQLPNILDRAADVLEQHGVAGERRVLKLIYLIVTSRVLPRPINASIKGPSSSGKSYTLERVLSLYPEDAYYSLSGMSEKALIYDDEPLVHRYLVIYEAAGLTGDFASYLMRSLLSEGRVRYVTVEKTSEGIKPRLLERDGPTGLLTTTTRVHLHPENETRMLSIPTTDSQSQTKQILMSIATSVQTDYDLTAWHALQTWISHADHNTVIPFARTLAEEIPPIAVRLRRDFGLLLALIRTHAILHQATRARSQDNQIVATFDDYAAVYHLAGDLLSAGLEATVPQTMRDTVAAVRTLTAPPNATLAGRVKEGSSERTTSVTEVAKKLQLAKSAASRRVRVAIDAGYLRNLEDKRGRPARITLGESLPEDRELLPRPEALIECCSVAGETGGIDETHPSSVIRDFQRRHTDNLPPTGTDGFSHEGEV